MRGQEYIRDDDKAAYRLAPKGVDGVFDLYVATNGCTDWHHLERPGRRLEWGHISCPPALPTRSEWNCLAADPAWEFKVYNGTGKQRSAERHYDTESLDAIKAPPVGRITKIFWGWHRDPWFFLGV
jgi:hypothetical protein